MDEYCFLKRACKIATKYKLKVDIKELETSHYCTKGTLPNRNDNSVYAKNWTTYESSWDYGTNLTYECIKGH